MKVIGYEDYVDRLHEEFSDVDIKSISDVLSFGCSRMLSYKQIGMDLYLKDTNNLKFYMYIGDITTDAYKRNGIYFKKKRRKLRHQYSLDRTEYNGYYYFGLTEEQNEKFKATGILDRAFYFKIEREVIINTAVKHIYKVKIEKPLAWFIILENHKETNAEYVSAYNIKKNETSST